MGNGLISQCNEHKGAVNVHIWSMGAVNLFRAALYWSETGDDCFVLYQSLPHFLLGPT